jgi:hypothetical protein
MGYGPGRAPHASTVQARDGHAGASMPASAWEGRLYAGLRVACVPAAVRQDLTHALGEAGVEAEFYLRLPRELAASAAWSPDGGERFLRGLEASAARLTRVAADLEVATQSYLTALEEGYPDVRAESDQADAWWPPFDGAASAEASGEPIELLLRRRGFAYRHVVAAHLASNVEAIAEQMALTLHALGTLPPAGTVPASALYRGLYELSSALHGYVVAHHIADMNERTPGLLSGIARLRELTRREDTALDADIAWARAQFAFVRDFSTPDAGVARPGADGALREWRETIAALEALRSSPPNTSAR